MKKVKVESKSEKEEKDKENQKVTWSSDENTLLIKVLRHFNEIIARLE